MAFPGQYAPPLPNQKPVVPKACWRLEGAEARLACAEHVLEDWPRLGRYRAANLLLAAPKPGEKRVVFYGDSITDNWSKPAAGGFFPGKPYVNRGISSQTTAQMLVRFRADVVALRPRVVVILAGTNDVAGNTGPTTPQAIEDNLASMAEIARANQIRVVLASLLPVSDEKRNAAGVPLIRTQERPPAVLQTLNRWMSDYARRERHIYLDYDRALSDAHGMLRADLTADGVHPNAAGYALMAQVAEKAIRTALQR
jgi:lysophospholipase L1-like esterase